MNEQTAAEIRQALGSFTGSASFTRWSPLFRRDVMTEGAKFVAEKAEAYWLMDAIASHQLIPEVRKEEMQVWTLQKEKSRWLLSATDGNGNPLAKQTIIYSDFPLEKIDFWACKNELGGITIMLPSEY